MNKGATGLWQRLRDAGLTNTGEAPPVSLDSPWYIRLMLGGAGWLAALFLLGFVAVVVAWVMENPAAAIVVGTGLMAACWYLQKRLPDNDFISQLGLACSFAGQALFIYGLFESLDLEFDDLTPWLLIVLLQATLAWIMPSAFHRLCSAFAAAGALVMLLFHAELVALAAPALLGLTAWLWLQHWYWPGQLRRCRAIAYGLSLAVAGLSCLNLGLQPLRDLGITYRLPLWSSEWLIGLVFLAVVIALLRRDGLALGSVKGALILACSLLLALASVKAPGISMGVCILLLGFANANRLLAGLGIAALLGYVGFYYYQLDISLMAKSGWLALIGLVLLLSRWLLARFPGQKPDQESDRELGQKSQQREVPHA